MNVIGKRLLVGCMGMAALLAGGVASATTITMGFDALTTPQFGQGVRVADYYNGGCSTTPSGVNVKCDGPSYGVVWNGAQIASSNIAENPPSAPNAATVQAIGRTATMNVAAGFTDGLSFYYAAGIAGNASVTVFDGLDGSGSQLARYNLVQNNTFATCGSASVLCHWDLFAAGFTGTAMSVVFSGGQNRFGFDDVSFDMHATGVPEPAELGMFGLGLLLIGTLVGLRRRFN